MARDTIVRAAPTRAVSLAVSAALIGLWAFVRLVVFDTTLFPLTYVLPLLVCIWTRDRVALWGMAAIFAALHLTKLFWIIPDQALTSAEMWASLIATLANIGVGAVAVHAIIGLRSRLETALCRVQAQADELRAQGEELAQQNEELTEQAEELSRQASELAQQSEELATQNEELQSQSEQIGTLNGLLSRRERLLETLFDTTRVTDGGDAALQHIVRAAPEMFGDVCAAVAVYEKAGSGFRSRATAPPEPSRDGADNRIVEDTFAALVLAENRTAALNDGSLRPDLKPERLSSLAPIGAMLGAPIRIGGQAVGVLAIYSSRSHDWNHEEFRLAEWLSEQCSRVLQAQRAQDALREADQRKSEFLATLSHELRNPLAPIRFALKLIEQGQTHGNAVRIMDRQFQQLVRLVDDLLDATRLSSNKIQLRKKRSDLIAIVQHAVEACRPDIETARHTLHVALPPEPLWLDADPERVAQVVTNLLNNAARYTPPGGTITVTVTGQGAEAALTVADTGIGLRPDDVERVFDMFTQVGGPGSGGLGIGLAIVRGIIELHGGRVEVRSDGIGHGSEFRVMLPLGASVTSEDAVDTMSLAPSVIPQRVLVVDDNTDATEMTAALLKLHGHDVWIAHDAEQALAVANEVVPDVALLDIGLPGLDGYELARRLRQGDATRHVRLVAVTGWGQDGDRARARDAGFDAHLTKPAEPGLILSAVAPEQSDDDVARRA